jgi:hypothetical protein
MTKLAERLQEGPIVEGDMEALNEDRSDLPAAVRSEFRVISISSTTGQAQQNARGVPVSDVYYLSDDERAAIRLWVEENREYLDSIDFSNRNAVQSSVDDEIYEAILEELGERKVLTYRNVVVEEYADGTTWIFRREDYEEGKAKRSRNWGVKLPPEQTPDSIYEEFEEEISAQDLNDWGIIGPGSRLIQYWIDNGHFECRRVNSERIEKLDSD